MNEESTRGEKTRRFVLSASVGTAAGVATAIILAIVLTVVDLYLSGHGRPMLSRVWISVPEWGISMSRADTIFLGGACFVALAAGALFALVWGRKKDE